MKLLEKLRWGKTVKCTYCQSTNNKRQKSDPLRHTCKNCKRSFSVFVDTIFEDTRLPLPKWFTIIGLMLNSKSGIASAELKQNVEGSYKSSYYAAMRVRIGMLEKETKLNGIIEMDESYFEAKQENDEKQNQKRAWNKQGFGGRNGSAKRKG